MPTPAFYRIAMSAASSPFRATEPPGLAAGADLIAPGQIGHASACRAFGNEAWRREIGHLAEHRLPDRRILIDSHHCSRYDRNTGKPNAAMSARAAALEEENRHDA